MRVGICGGTFDPFHRGHLDPILSVRESMQWDRVVYIPAFIQPFKQDRETAPSHHRFAMTTLAIEEHDALYADPRELERGSVSYTVETLRELRKENPEATIDWIIGDDNLEKLHEWKNIDEIFALANFTVLTRAPILNPQSSILNPTCCVTDPSDRPKNGAMVYAHNPLTPVSSTEIRQRIREGNEIEDLVPARVSRYIQHYGLYRKGQS
ncbi:MAG TPA: nicotinate (nicotinamide) nucleotide adenylyltransferase [Thermoanaerobaculia bacterium]|nr:nicotinate (nicotinamide) nucleotide adenylyltransferase [Thermoanaerobaculia bacterium]